MVDDDLSVDHVVDVARGYEKVELSRTAIERMEWARAHVQGAASGSSKYGLSTGVGDLASQRVDPAAAAENQRALVRSHAVATGPPLPTEVVRAMLLLKIRTLASGVTGARPVVALKLIEMLNGHLHPVVPCQGSLGASGDLARLAHLALPVIGEGEIEREGEVTETSALAPADRTGPIQLEGKEALSLINGTEGMLALGILALRCAKPSYQQQI